MSKLVYMYQSLLSLFRDIDYFSYCAYFVSGYYCIFDSCMSREVNSITEVNKQA